MKTEITEQERKAIEEAAVTSANETFGVIDDATSDIDGAFHDYHQEAFILGAEFAHSELRKPSGDLIQEIHSTLLVYSREFKGHSCVLYGQSFIKAATEIAKLLPPSKGQENDVNVELLEALKMIRDDINSGEPASYGFLEHIKTISNSAISNAEKQILANPSQTCKDCNKSIRFAEWLGVCSYSWCESDDCYCNKSTGLLYTVESLYGSQEFEEYLKKIKQ